MKKRVLKRCTFCGDGEGVGVILTDVELTMDTTTTNQPFFFRLKARLCGLCAQELSPHQAINRIARIKKKEAQV